MIPGAPFMQYSMYMHFWKLGEMAEEKCPFWNFLCRVLICIKNRNSRPRNAQDSFNLKPTRTRSRKSEGLRIQALAGNCLRWNPIPTDHHAGLSISRASLLVLMKSPLENSKIGQGMVGGLALLCGAGTTENRRLISDLTGYTSNVCDHFPGGAGQKSEQVPIPISLHQRLLCPRGCGDHLLESAYVLRQ